MSTYGIDLGTTYSCVARVSDYDDSLADIIRSKDNEAVMPSVVLFQSDGHVVGRVAKNKARLKPDQTASLFKRDMGEDHPIFEALGKDYHAHELSALVLEKLVANVKEATGEEVRDVIITCPAYFGFKQRAATRRAGEIAGLNVLGIINEPTAAAVYYGARLEAGAPTQGVLVYDLGGGTFDVSVVRCEPDGIVPITSHGNSRLGGANWDDALLAHVAERFLELNPGADDPRDTPADEQELLKAIEEAKQALTEIGTTEVAIRSGATLGEVEVDRETFDRVTAQLLDETLEYTRQAKQDAEKKGATIDTIVLVGGSSKMPQVARALEAEFGLVPEMREPDLAVAKGAALAAERLAQLREEEEQQGDGRSARALPGARIQRDICPWSFGILTLDPDTDAEEIYYLMDRDEPIPASRTEEFATRSDDQTRIESGIFQQRPGAPPSKLPDENEKIADFIVEDLPLGYPKGTLVQVTLTMDAGGLIVATAKHPGRDEPGRAEVRVELGGPSVEESREKLKGALVRR